MRIKNNPLIHTLLGLRGNPRACVYTEPLWTIPFNLYAPFVAVYMAALMLSDWQIGIVASVFAFSQAVFALLSGAITDKLGRRLCTLIFDTLSWSVPALLWAFSQNFWWFVVAAGFNGMMQITTNSWTCLLIEDAENSKLVNIFALCHISGQLAVVFAPIAGMLVNNLSIIPAMRILYGFTFLSMTAKFIILYIYSDETKVGKVRKKETAGMSIPKIMHGYGDILKKIFKSRGMVLALVIMTMFGASSIVIINFFGLYATENLNMPQHMLAYFPILRAVITIIFLFGLQGLLARFGFNRPIIAGFVLHIVSHAILILSPPGMLSILFIYIFLDSCAISLVMPRRESMTAILIEPSERARITGLLASLSFGVTIPFGVLAGWLSNIDRRLPFIVNIAIFIAAICVIFFNRKYLSEKLTQAPT